MRHHQILLRLGALILALMLGATPLQAQSATPLVIGVTETGEVSPAIPAITYAFAGEAGALTISITSTSNAFIPAYTLADGLGATLSENPNTARAFVLNDMQTLPETNLYLLTITPADGVSFGTFDVILTVTGGQPAPTTAPTTAPANNGGAPLSCDGVIDQSMDIIDNICANTGRNEVCYGNLSIQVDTRNNAPVTFATQGDIVQLALVDNIVLSPLDPVTNEWGVALMQVQADLPDTVPGQNVAVLVFGDVQISDAVPTGSNMQSFYFSSGVGRATCGETPTDGILIRTPDGIGTVTLNINEVDITLGSTAFLSVQPSEALEVTMLEGFGQVQTNGGSQIAAAGQRIKVPVNEQGLPVGQPTFPEVVPLEPYENLPVEGLLESAPQPSLPIIPIQPIAQVTTAPTPLPNAQATITPTSAAGNTRPVLPTTGNCMLRTFLDTEVNVRNQPNQDTSTVTAFIRPDRLYRVTAVYEDYEWYRLESPFGWVAGFATERGGDCDRIALVPFPTPTPLPTMVPTVVPTRVTDVDPFYVTVDYNGSSATYSSTLSMPDMDDEDTFIYTFANVPMPPFMRTFNLSITCSSASGAVVYYDYEGSIGVCDGMAANFSQLGDFDMNNTGMITLFFDQSDPSSRVTWTITLGFV